MIENYYLQLSDFLFIYLFFELLLVGTGYSVRDFFFFFWSKLLKVFHTKTINDELRLTVGGLREIFYGELLKNFNITTINDI